LLETSADQPLHSHRPVPYGDGTRGTSDRGIAPNEWVIMKRACGVAAATLLSGSILLSGATAASATEIPSGRGCNYGQSVRTTIMIYGSDIVHKHRFNTTLVTGTRYNYNAAPAYDPYITVATLGLQSATSTGYGAGHYISVVYTDVSCAG